MAIRMIYGVPGSGKSYYTTQEIILKNLKNGRKVITNIQLNIDYLVEVLDIPNELIKIVHSEKGDYSDTFRDVSDYKDDWRNKNNQAPVIIVDEAHFPLSKTRRKDEVVEIENFFSTHRQAGYDIYLITQDPKRIPKDVLGFVDTYYEVRKQRKIGSSLFSVYIYDNCKKLLGDKSRRYNKEIFKCYKSHLLSNSNIEEDNSTVGVKTVWQSPIFILTCLSFLVLIIGFLSGYLSLSFDKVMKIDEINTPSNKLNDNVDIDVMEDISKDNTKIKSDEIVIPKLEKNNVSDENSIIVEKSYLSQVHPLDGKLLQIRTMINNDALISLYDKKNKNKLGSLTSQDLRNMGYKVDLYSSCSMKLTYEKIHFFVDCSEIKNIKKEGGEQIFTDIIKG